MAGVTLAIRDAMASRAVGQEAGMESMPFAARLPVGVSSACLSDLCTRQTKQVSFRNCHGHEMQLADQPDRQMTSHQQQLTSQRVSTARSTRVASRADPTGFHGVSKGSQKEQHCW